MRGTLSSSTPAASTARAAPSAAFSIAPREDSAASSAVAPARCEGLGLGARARACFFAVVHAKALADADVQQGGAAETRCVPMPRCPPESPERLSPPRLPLQPRWPKVGERLSGLSPFATFALSGATLAVPDFTQRGAVTAITSALQPTITALVPLAQDQVAAWDCRRQRAAADSKCGGTRTPAAQRSWASERAAPAGRRVSFASVSCSPPRFVTQPARKKSTVNLAVGLRLGGYPCSALLTEGTAALPQLRRGAAPACPSCPSSSWA
jgi:hypothetical protein